MSLFLSVSLRIRNKLHHSRVLLPNSLFPILGDIYFMGALKITSTRETSCCKSKCSFSSGLADGSTKVISWNACMVHTFFDLTVEGKVTDISRYLKSHHNNLKRKRGIGDEHPNRQTWAQILTLLLSNCKIVDTFHNFSESLSAKDQYQNYFSQLWELEKTEVESALYKQVGQEGFHKLRKKNFNLLSLRNFLR